MKCIDKGRKALDEQGNVYPGGDSCSMTVARGLASIHKRLMTTAFVDWTENELEVIDWIQNWINAAGSCPMTVARGLQALLIRADAYDDNDSSITENEHEAIAWIQNWINAAGIMPDHDLTIRGLTTAPAAVIVAATKGDEEVLRGDQPDHGIPCEECGYGALGPDGRCASCGRNVCFSCGMTAGASDKPAVERSVRPEVVLDDDSEPDHA